MNATNTLLVVGKPRAPCCYSMAMLALPSASSSLFQGCVQKWFVLRRKVNMPGTVTLLGEAAYRREEQGASGGARPTDGDP